jgi:hypothetical protein
MSMKSQLDFWQIDELLLGESQHNLLVHSCEVIPTQIDIRPFMYICGRYPVKGPVQRDRFG